MARNNIERSEFGANVAMGEFAQRTKTPASRPRKTPTAHSADVARDAIAVVHSIALCAIGGGTIVAMAGIAVAFFAIR